MSSSTPSQPQSTPTPTWTPSQYLKFSSERTRPAADLVSFLAPLITSPTPRIYDLGCGTGTSTSLLQSAFPRATITGLDSSPAMLETARSTASLADIDFIQADVAQWTPPAHAEKLDLLFSNAVFHWLRHASRVESLARLLGSPALKAGGVLAFQVPDNYDAPTHRCMRTTAGLPARPWSQYFAASGIGQLGVATRPDLDPVESAAELYDVLVSAGAARVDVWRTEYFHALPSVGGIVEWVRGTGLMPYLERMKDGEGRVDEEAKEAFLEEYERALGEAYTERGDGRVLLGYPRLFVVAVKG